MPDHTGCLSSQERVCSSRLQLETVRSVQREGHPRVWGRVWRTALAVSGEWFGECGRGFQWDAGPEGEGAEDHVIAGLGGRCSGGVQRGTQLVPAWAPGVSAPPPPALCTTLGEPTECGVLFEVTVPNPVRLTGETRTTMGLPLSPAPYTKGPP